MTNPVIPPNPNMPPSSGGGMPKWLIILLVVGLIVVLGCCGGIAACHFMCTAVAKNGAGALQQFVQDEQKKAGVNVNLAGGSISLPANFPSDVPVYSGFTAMTSVTPPGQSGGTVSFKGSADPQKVMDYYQTQLKGKGWNQEQATANPNALFTAFSKDDQQITISVEGDASSSILIVNYGKK